jgi:hypothetical protein
MLVCTHLTNAFMARLIVACASLLMWLLMYCFALAVPSVIILQKWKVRVLLVILLAVIFSIFIGQLDLCRGLIGKIGEDPFVLPMISIEYFGALFVFFLTSIRAYKKNKLRD